MVRKTPKTKVCSKCGKRRLRRNFPNDKKTKSGLASWCKGCYHKQAVRFRTEHPDKKFENNRRSLLKQQYGITPEQYDTMLKAQKGVCAICGAPPKTRRLNVDHDHKTKCVRGLLCFLCNRALGLLRDDPARCKAAAAYLGRRRAAGLV